MQINIEVSYRLIVSFFCCSWPGMLKVPEKRSLHIFAVSPEKRGEGAEVDFLPADKHESSLPVDSIFFGICIARHAQSTQSNKFAIFLQYLKQNVNDEADFLHGDKHQRFLQIDTIIFGLCGQAYQNYPK